jgi:hypothetical protein
VHSLIYGKKLCYKDADKGLGLARLTENVLKVFHLTYEVIPRTTIIQPSSRPIPSSISLFMPPIRPSYN